MWGMIKYEQGSRGNNKISRLASWLRPNRLGTFACSPSPRGNALGASNTRGAVQSSYSYSLQANGRAIPCKILPFSWSVSILTRHSRNCNKEKARSSPRIAEKCTRLFPIFATASTTQRKSPSSCWTTILLRSEHDHLYTEDTALRSLLNLKRR